MKSEVAILQVIHLEEAFSPFVGHLNVRDAMVVSAKKEARIEALKWVLAPEIGEFSEIRREHNTRAEATHEDI
jgi:hypothetical protein